ncbi:MAG TPA: hypothetical protein VLT83_05830 [Opitutaceae bacterium]|nr:hypothetical protein [Opitutaceae bacterium]
MHPYISCPPHPEAATRRRLRLIHPIMRSAAILIAGVFLAAPSARADGFQGRPARAGDLPGAWVRATPGNWVGIEFTRDGQVIVTQDLTAGLEPLVQGQHTTTFTFHYTVLEGGRVSFAAPSGQTMVFETRTAGDVLELTIPSEQVEVLGIIGLQFGGSQRFRRLPSGKSLTEAIREENERMAAEREQRLAAVKRILSAGNIVVVPQQGNAPLIVLKSTPASGGPLQGVAVVDESPERMDFVKPIRAHPFQISFGEGPEVTVTIALANAIEPLSERQVSGRIVLKAEGSVDHPALAGTVDFTANRQGARCVLKSDGQIASAVLARLDQQLKAMKAMFATVAGPLGGRAILVGTKPVQGMPQPQPVQLVVQRSPDGAGYIAQAQVGRTQLGGGAALDLVVDRPVLHVAFQGGEEWRLRVNPDGKGFSGDWRPYAGADFLSNGTVTLTVQRMWTVEQLAAIAKAVEHYIAADLRAGVEFAGRVSGVFASSEQTTVPVPVSLKIQSQPDGKLTGQAWFVAQQGGFELEGAAVPNTGMLALKSTGVMEGSDKEFVEHGLGSAPLACALQLDIDPTPKLTGALKSTGPWGGGGATEFEPVSDTAIAEQRGKILDALGRGVNFLIKQDQGMKPGYVRLKADGAGKISGDLVGSPYDSFDAPGIFSGEIAAEHGQALVKLVYRPAPQLNGNQFPDQPTSLLAAFDGDKLTLAGWLEHPRMTAANGRRSISGVTFLPLPPSEKVPVTDLERLVLAAARLGAKAERASNLVTSTNPGDQTMVLLYVRGIGGYIQGGYADGRYQYGLAGFSAAAMHAGILTPKQLFAIVRVTFAPPFTDSIPASEQNGIKVFPFTANPKRPSTTPTFRIESVSVD